MQLLDGRVDGEKRVEGRDGLREGGRDLSGAKGQGICAWESLGSNLRIYIFIVEIATHHAP